MELQTCSSTCEPYEGCGLYCAVTNPERQAAHCCKDGLEAVVHLCVAVSVIALS